MISKREIQMYNTNKKFVVYVLHHSHTDVGYTETQEKIKHHHVGFLKEVVDLIDLNKDFKWNCESYWCVEQFFRYADSDYRNRFIRHVKNGNISISGSYLNLTDLASELVLNQTLDRCVSALKDYGLNTNVAMTADINGYGWGFAESLYSHGIKNLLSCIHTHHGYHPLKRKQNPFYWRTPEGNKILVWNGEHYLFGNELGIAQASHFEYTIQDGLSFAYLTPFEKSEKRIFAYINDIVNQGYEYNFIPVNVSGNMTDNSPPSLLILDFINKFNEKHSQNIELKMATLDEFFARVNQEKNIPEYSGDWTDWWADGIASTPADVIHYRNASRKYSLALKADKNKEIAGDDIYQNALYNLMFYAEHTWGYSSSITEPFHPQVNNLDQWKRLFALKANEAATIAVEKIQRHYGETAISLHRRLTFKAVNPHDVPVKDVLVCDLEHFYGFDNFDVVDEATNEIVPHQISRYSRGPEIVIFLDLKPHETKNYILREREPAPLKTPGLSAERGIEGIYDLYYRIEQDKKKYGSVYIDEIDNQYFNIKYGVSDGITSVFDKKGNRELLKPDRKYNAFTPIYEVTPRDLAEDYLWVRRNMGRNRKAVRTKRCCGQLFDVKVLENGPVYARAELKYNLEGAENCSVILTVFHVMPKITVDLRLHKKSVWEPENLYLALPFLSEEGGTYIDKAGAIMRPRIDQLPGTCTDYYAVQNGVAFIKDNSAVLISTPDVPLVSMGALETHAIKLMGDGVKNNDDVYSYVMNNFWETNFKASLGGFYQFRYHLNLPDTNNPEEIFRISEAVNEGTLNFYSFR
jgi:hypothetical protein